MPLTPLTHAHHFREQTEITQCEGFNVKKSVTEVSLERVAYNNDQTSKQKKMLKL